MKLKSTLPLIIGCLVVMVGTGTASALIGYQMGHQALKSVSQPDINPTRKLSAQSAAAQGGAQKIVPEKEILVKVYDRINAKGQSDTNSQKPTDREQSSQKPVSGTPPCKGGVCADRTAAVSGVALAQSQAEKPQTVQFPLQTQDAGVILEVLEAERDNGSLLLDVSLKNNSGKAVRFLYSLLEIKDDQNRTLSAIAEGLPGELPPNSQIFEGTVSIPLSLLEDAQQISLTLTDYPEQNLQLTVSEIPVARQEP